MEGDVLIELTEDDTWVLHLISDRAKEIAGTLFPPKVPGVLPNEIRLEKGVAIEDILELFPDDLLYHTKMPKKMLN